MSAVDDEDVQEAEGVIAYEADDDVAVQRTVLLLAHGDVRAIVIEREGRPTRLLIYDVREEEGPLICALVDDRERAPLVCALSASA